MEALRLDENGKLEAMATGGLKLFKAVGWKLLCHIGRMLLHGRIRASATVKRCRRIWSLLVRIVLIEKCWKGCCDI